MTQRFTLDPPAFEQVLSAISLVQQLKKQVPQAFTVDPEDAPLMDLAEIQQAIEMEVLDLDAAMHRVVKAALQLSAASGAGIWLFSDHNFALRVGAGVVADSDAMRLEVLARLSASDLADRHEAIAGIGLGDSPVKSVLVTPIHQGRNVAGALAILSSQAEAFSERDGTRARLLSGVLAHALDKASASELKQSLSLERAAMLEVMDQLMPALRKLGAHGEGERQAAERAAFIAELAPEPGAAVVAAELARLGNAPPSTEPGLTGAGSQDPAGSGAQLGNDAIGSEPNIFLLLQKEVEESREVASPPKQSLDGAPVTHIEKVADAAEVVAAVDVSTAKAVEERQVVAAPVVCAPIAEGMAQAEKEAKAVREGIHEGPSLGTLAARAWELVAALIQAWIVLLSGKLQSAGSALEKTEKAIVAHLRGASDRAATGSSLAARELRERGAGWVRTMANAWTKTRQVLTRPVRVRVPGWTKGKPQRPSRKPSRRNAKSEATSRKAAGPAVVLLITAAFLVMMKTAGDSSNASVVSPPVTAASFDPGADVNPNGSASSGGASATTGDTSAAASSEKSASTTNPTAWASDRGVAKQAIEQRTEATSGAVLRESHLRITDWSAAATLHSMSQYEFAGLQRQALFGDDTAELLLGMAYETGYGVPQSCVQAAEWVARSAAAGNAAAQYNLGLRYRDGDGLAVDPGRAGQWLQKATARKYTPAPVASIE